MKCRNLSAQEGSIWPVITKVVSLRQLCVDADLASTSLHSPFEGVSEETVNYLSKLKSVTLQGARANFSARIGRAVIEFDSTPGPQISAGNELLSLEECPCMKRLRLLNAGVETVLSETVKSLPELELLYLNWVWARAREDPLPVQGFVEAWPGKIMGAILVASSLTELRLVNVRI